MQTNFFHTLSALSVRGDWKITIKQNGQQLIVSVLLQDQQCGDDAAKTIPPLILKGTPIELDEGFFNNITAPVKATAQLFANMEAYMKAQETAQLESKMEKQKQTQAEQEKSAQEKKYEAAMKKAEELKAEGKPREAWMKLPDPAAFPQYADIIRSRKAELSAQFQQPSLF